MRKISLIGALALSAFFSTAQASVAIYTSKAAFNAAATIGHTATFEGLHFGVTASPLVQDGIRFHNPLAAVGGHEFYIAPAGGLGGGVEATSATLTQNGDETFDIRLDSGADFSAIGFDAISNAYGPRKVSFFTNTGILIESILSPQAPSTFGFLGFISSTPIGYMTNTVDRGRLQNTAIDNVRIGSGHAAAGVPEPATWAMLFVGLGMSGAALRGSRRRRAAA